MTGILDAGHDTGYDFIFSSGTSSTLGGDMIAASNRVMEWSYDSIRRVQVWYQTNSNELIRGIAVYDESD